MKLIQPDLAFFILYGNDGVCHLNGITIHFEVSAA